LRAPLAVGPLTLAHRVLMSAHGMGLGDGGVGVSDRYRAYLVERARGGAAMVGIESAPVPVSTASRGLVIRLDRDEAIPSLACAADAIHECGTVDLFTPEAVWGSAAGAVTFESGAVAGMLERGATRLKANSRTIAQTTESNNKQYMLLAQLQVVSRW
jgi:hypothetical protein